ncbi:hypothetical protein R3F72_15100 [Salinicola sp. 4072]|uniref:hypothetical protein n=1 Tax=Salinicola sp. 4072 TaxID=3082157 RepID=UPI002FCCB5E4
MKLELNLSALVEAVRPVSTPGYRPLSLTLDLPPFPPRVLSAQPTSQGELPVVDTGGEEITWQEFEEVEGPGGLLQKNSQQIMMYMPSHYPARYENALLDGKEGNRIHVAFCSHLEKMKASGKFDSKYFATQDLHGAFRIYENFSSRVGDAELKVCKLCLRKLNYKGYLAPGRGKSDIFRNFSYEFFFEEYESFFPSHPMRNMGNERDRGYTEDWSRISLNYRASCHYPASFTRVLIERSEGTDWWHRLSGSASSARIAVE